MIQPFIRYIQSIFPLKENLIGLIILLTFYFIGATLLGWGIFKGIILLIDLFQHFPIYYHDYILPLFQYLSTLSFMNHDILTILQDSISQYGIHIVTWLSQMVKYIPAFFFSFFLFVLATFFLTIEYDTLKYQWVKYSSKKITEMMIYLKQQVLKSFRFYMRCQLLLMMVCFVILLIGFCILKYPHPLLYSLVIALLDGLPFIGVGIALIPLCLFYLINGVYLKGLYIILLYILINFLRSLLEPHIMNKQMKIPSFLLLLSMIIHLHFFGMIGVILSPIHMSVLFSMLQYHDS